MRPGAGARLAAGLLPAVLLVSCGGSRSTAPTARAASTYSAKWEPQYRLDRSGKRLITVSRSTREIGLQVVDQTCHPNDPRFADASRRFAGATVQEQHAAVIVTVHLHPKPPVRGCAPAGIGFPITVRLPHPLGPRALVDGGAPRIGGGGSIALIRIPAQNRALEREAEARYGRPDIAAVP